MKKRLINLFAIIGIASLIGSWLMIPAVAGSARDCDSNSVIYCGAYSTTELANKINKGTGQPHQSSTELKALFAKYGIYTSDFGHLKNGRVTKDNKVYVGNTKVADNVYSMGRHKTANSIDVPGISYPLWLRHPAESFNSSSIDAFVMLNYDGSLRYAVIKSCGNIVPGTIKNKPVEKYTLNVVKWNDLNADNHKQANEPTLPNWQFKISGANLASTKTIKTNSKGIATITGLTKGTYTVEEIQQAGWRAVTAPKRNIYINENTTIYFGNVKIAPQTISVKIVKFNDANSNKKQDSNEQRLSGWEFRVTGNGVNKTLKTGANGEVTLSGLKPGNYTVTEINKSGWTNTTGLSINRNVTTDPKTQTFIFGNKKISTPPPVVPPGGGEIETPEVPEITAPTPLPTSGPAETAAAAFSITTLSGGALAWVRSKKKLLETFKK